MINYQILFRGEYSFQILVSCGCSLLVLTPCQSAITHFPLDIQGQYDIILLTQWQLLTHFYLWVISQPLYSSNNLK